MTERLPQSTFNRRVTSRRQHDRLTRPGRRWTDRREPADNRRVLLVGPDKGWRLQTAYVFEEAGYAVYAAAGERRAVGLTTRLLPDVVVVKAERPETFDVLAGLSEAATSFDIPVVVLTSTLQSTDAPRGRAAAGVTRLTEPDEIDALIGEVDTLIATVPRTQRTLRRRLLNLQQLARYHTRSSEGQLRLLHLVDRLQGAIIVVEERGRCIAVSRGATRLTGHSRSQLLNTSVFDFDFPGGQVSAECWERFLAGQYHMATRTIKNRAGENVIVHVAAIADIMPGLHAAAFVPS